MNIFLSKAPLSCILAAAILSGCALPKAAPDAETGNNVAALGAGKAAGVGAPAAGRPDTPMQSQDQVALNDGINLYNNGNFKNAIKRLGSACEIWATGPKSTQIAALKYMAFSYCVTGRRTLCRRQFEKAIKLDPAFDLAPGENGHPLWGPAFVRAKKRK